MTEWFRRLKTMLTRWAWYTALKAQASDSEILIGPDQELELPPNSYSFRIAPSQMGTPVASFWVFIWKEDKDDIYVAGRNHTGVHKLSFHETGVWLSSVNGARKRLAPGKLLPCGQWRHALQLSFLLSDDMLPPGREKPFRKSAPANMVECPPGEGLVLHLLLGMDGTTLQTPLPEGFDSRRLAPMTLGSGRCAILVGESVPLTDSARRAIAEARTQRFDPKEHPGLVPYSIEAIQVGIHDGTFNLLNVIPLGPESIPAGLPEVPAGAKHVKSYTTRPT